MVNGENFNNYSYGSKDNFSDRGVFALGFRYI